MLRRDEMARASLASPIVLSVGLALSCSERESIHAHFELSGSSDTTGWSQWGMGSTHQAHVAVAGQTPAKILASSSYDPFVVEERKEAGGDILVHYQAPLIAGDSVYMAFKTGAYVACNPPGSGMPAPCGSDTWSHEVWGERGYQWINGSLVQTWAFTSDFQPVPDAGGGLGEWEPVFHGALAGDYIVVPAKGGTIDVLLRSNGSLVARVNPFDDLADNRFVSGPLTVDAKGNVYYNVIAFSSVVDPWRNDIVDAWLVVVAPDGTTRKVSYQNLAPAPKTCTGGFTKDDLPWPPAPDAKPKEVTCGKQRPGVNVAPAVGPDGAIYTAARTHFARRYGNVVAINPDLSLRWASSLRGHLGDGCNSAIMPKTGDPGGCKMGARDGVDPQTNDVPAGIVEDQSTASPVVAPDGSILYGAYTRYNYARGHLFKISSDGAFLAAYDFGWDVTPGIYPHDGTYSIVVKDNRYDIGSYCADDKICPPVAGGPYQITQLDKDLAVEWAFTSDNQKSCVRKADGTISCVADHPNGFEWCINAPAIDRRGVVYANSEDGVLYAIDQGGKTVKSLFLGESVGAAYTPLSLDAQGRIYAENLGSLFVVGQ